MTPTWAGEVIPKTTDPVQAFSGETVSPTASPDLWSRIRKGLQLPETNPALVLSQEQWFSRHNRYLEITAERSRLYLFHIVEEVEKRGMPMEIALLPMIESAFNPQALSPMKASGIWQFIPSTGRIFGLEQNGWFDGRRDVLQATEAALDYLQKLYGMFGDWELALAAYNCGEGCVSRAQNRSKDGTDYTSIKLPKETRHYVPRLIAVRNIISDPVRYGINLPAIPDEPYFMRIQLSHAMEAKQAAKLAEMNLSDFLNLNPGFQRRVIHTESRNVLLLPVEKVEVFQFNLHREGLDRKTLQTYSASRGEKASSIAARFGVTLDWLKEHNPLKLRKGVVDNPQILMVPVAQHKSPQELRTDAGPSALTAPAPTPSKSDKKLKADKQKRGVTRIHTVRKGDTLMRVARLYNVKVGDIRRLNSDIEPLIPGSKLTIPVSS
jgi:membrane-bound lytic murein transglycosylase D